MDAALILLLRLRLFGALRRVGRKLGTVRGLLLTVLGLSFFVPMIASSFFAKMPTEVMTAQAEGFRRFGPFFFVLYCVMILLFSPGDKAFAFTPAEVSFLFPGPFGRRSLLAYKIGGNLALSSLGSLFFLWAFRQFWRNPFAGYVGIVMGFSFLQLFQVGVSVAGQAIGAKASTRRRQLALFLIVAIVGLLAFSLGVNSLRGLQEINFETLKRLETRPWVVALKMPFVPIVNTVTAPRIWPDVPLWGSISLAMNALIFALILGLDAQYLEAAAVSSERFYARLERMRKGGPSVTSKRKNQVWKELPALPWLGGIGPIFWRQLTTAVRDYARAAVPFVSSGLIAGFGIYLALFVGHLDGTGEGAMLGCGVAILATSLIMSQILTFDFRGDFERMEGLKTLPLHPSRIVLGQIAAPWLLMTLGQYFGFAFMAMATRSFPRIFWAYFAFAPMLNLLLFECDNLMFLLFPSRPIAHTPGDFQAMGRMTLMMMSKMLMLALALGAASLLGFAAYFLAGMVGAMVVAWLVMGMCGVAFVPLISMAFRRFDVASETPS